MQKHPVAALAVLFLLLWGCAAAPQKKTSLPADEEAYTKAMEFFSSRNYFDSIPAFEELREKFPLSPYAVLAEIRLGESHFYKNEFAEAVHYFENFRRLHPSNMHVPYSIYMTGMCYYRQILSPDRDQTSAQMAAEHFQTLLELYPASPYTGKALYKITEAKRRIAEHEFIIGAFYLNNKHYQGAIERFRKILKNYPESISKDRLLFSLARATLGTGDQDRGEKILQLLVRTYPASSYAEEARTLLARQQSDAKQPQALKR